MRRKTRRLGGVAVTFIICLIFAGPPASAAISADDPAEALWKVWGGFRNLFCSSESGESSIKDCTRDIEAGHDKGADLALDYFHRANAYNVLGIFDSASADYDKVIELDTEVLKSDPKDTAAHSVRGLAYLAKRDYDHAISDFSEILKIVPSNSAAYRNRGAAYEAKGDTNRAISDFGMLIQINPNNGDAYIRRGFAHSHQGDSQKAISDFTAALGVGPDADAYVGRGLGYQAISDQSSAKADFEAALALPQKYPHDKWAHDTALKGLEALKAYETAHAAAAVAVNPDAPPGGTSWYASTLTWLKSFGAGDWLLFGVLSLVGVSILVLVVVLMFADLSDPNKLQNTYAHGGARPSATEEEALAGARG
ncbi:MAG TPA: tetratricopeptide repeat protein, partial [Candidatus Angelobacter sp.]|nr:tetratricopeptide repeat protein [Candidatus Angelobacter sp.]